MTQARLAHFRFRPGQRQAWLDWSEELARRREEVIATLRNEGVVSESCFLSEDGESVYWFMEADDFERARRAVASHPLPIDVAHATIRDASLELVGVLRCLFHFDGRDA